MALTAPMPQGKDFGPREEPKLGMRPARVFRIVDIGTHLKKGFQGAEDKMVRMVRIDWELPADLLTTGDNAGRPMCVGETFTFSTADKAKLRTKVINPLFPGLSKDQGFKFDLTRLLGQECFVSLVRSAPTADGKTYINIAQVTPLPEGYPVSKEGANPQIVYGLGDADTWDAIPEWLRRKVMESAEMQAAHGPSMGLAATGTENEVPF